MNTKTYSTPHGKIDQLDTFKGKKALIGDYSSFSYYNTKMVLLSLGFDVHIASTIEEIENKILNGEKYDIIFTNNIYREGTGENLLKILKNIKDFDTPIIIHTISNNVDNYFIKQGFNGYLKKPIRQDETLDLLKQLLKTKKDETN